MRSYPGTNGFPAIIAGVQPISVLSLYNFYLNIIFVFFFVLTSKSEILRTAGRTGLVISQFMVHYVIYFLYCRLL